MLKVIRKEVLALFKNGRARGNWPRIALALCLTLAVVGALVHFSSPAEAITLQISNLPNVMSAGSSYTFTAQVNIQTNERVPINDLRLDLAGPTPGFVIFGVSGNVTSQSPAGLIAQITPVGTPSFSPGEGWAQGFGYGDVGTGYYTGNWRLGYGSHPQGGGYTGALTYSVTLNTAALALGSYSAQLTANVPDGASPFTFGWYNFDLGAGYAVQAGTKYALVLRAPDADASGVNQIQYSVVIAGTYGGGSVNQSSNSGGAWFPLAYDALFQELQGTTIFESYTQDTVELDNLYSTLWKTQTFTPAASHTVNVVRFRLLKQGSPAGNVIVSLRATDGSGMPTGPDLATGSITCASVGTTVTKFLSPAIPFTVLTSGGGGGGGFFGGGGVTTYPVATTGFNASTPLVVDSQGYTQSAVTLTTPDGRLTLTIPANTRLLNSTNGPLSSLTITALASPPAAPAGNALVLAYTFSPDGAQFIPPFNITFKYDPATLPAGVAEADLYLAKYVNGQWTPLSTAVNTSAKTLTSSLSGFSTYGVLGKVTPPPTTPIATTTTLPPTSTTTVPPTSTTRPPTSTATVPPTSSVTPTQTTPAPTQTSVAPTSTQPVPSTSEPVSGGGRNWLVLGLIAAAVVIVIVVLVILLARPQNRN